MEFILGMLDLQELYKETEIELTFMKDYNSITIRVGYRDKAICHTFSIAEIEYIVSTDLLLNQICEMVEDVRRA